MSLLGNPIVQAFLKNQISTLAAAGSGALGGLAAQAGYTPGAVAGSLGCILALALQAAIDYVSHKSIPVGPQPAPKA